MLDSAAVIYETFGAELQARDREVLRVLLLDTKLRLLAVEDVALGSLNECIAHPREIFRPAIIHSAYAAILVHNHPSGDPAPSQADHRLTRQLGDAAKLLQINFWITSLSVCRTAGEFPTSAFAKQACYEDSSDRHRRPSSGVVRRRRDRPARDRSERASDWARDAWFKPTQSWKARPFSARKT